MNFRSVIRSIFRSPKLQNEKPVNNSDDFSVEKPVEKSDEKPVKETPTSIYSNIYYYPDGSAGMLGKMTDPYRDTEHPEWDDDGGNGGRGLRFDDGTPIFRDDDNKENT